VRIEEKIAMDVCSREGGQLEVDSRRGASMRNEHGHAQARSCVDDIEQRMEEKGVVCG
jgi:hypothetical protein